MATKVLYFVLTALALLTMAGCGLPLTAPAPQAVEAPVWPRPPAAARIRYVRSVVKQDDWGIAPGFFGRLVDALTGKGRFHFVRPTGVVEQGGVLFVADPGARAVFILDAASKQVREVRSVGGEMLVSPVALAPGPAGGVFVADSWRKKVYALDAAGKLLRVVAHEGLERPSALAFDAARERLYVADSKMHRIRVYAPDGSLLQTFGGIGRGQGEFNAPTHLALTPDHGLLVTDALNFRIQSLDAEGRFRWMMGRVGDGSGDFSAPKGVAADSAGRMYVADALFDTVQIFSDAGELLLNFGERGTRAGQFWLPGGLFINAQNVLYVADGYNQRIQVFQVIPNTSREDAK